MGRFLLIAAVVVVAVWLIRRALLRGRSGAPGSDAGGARPPAAGQGDLVKCAHCGTHLPRVEARPAGELLYCSDEHARLGPVKR
jgi:uncharacterized protein